MSISAKLFKKLRMRGTRGRDYRNVLILYVRKAEEPGTKQTDF